VVTELTGMTANLTKELNDILHNAKEATTTERDYAAYETFIEPKEEMHSANTAKIIYDIVYAWKVILQRE